MRELVFSQINTGNTVLDQSIPLQGNSLQYIYKLILNTLGLALL